jgi:uncharacterized membrane protein YfcA
MISAIVGMAGGVTLLSILIIFLPYHVVIPIHGAVQLVSNFTRSLFLRKYIHYKFFCFYALGLPVGALVSISLLKQIDNVLLPKLLIVLFIFYVLFKPKKLPKVVLPAWGFSFVGVISGILSLLIGATGPFLAPFFLRDDLKKEQIIATKASVQAITHLLKIPAFIYLGFPYFEYLSLSVSLVLATIIGTKIGIQLLGKIDERIFRLLYKTALFAAALKLIWDMISL